MTQVRGLSMAAVSAYFNPLMPTVGVAIKQPVPDRVKPSFVIFDIWTL